MDMKKMDVKEMVDSNNELKITYIRAKSHSKYVYFTGSTLSELLDVVKKDYDHDQIIDEDAWLLFDLYWFDDDDDKKEIKVFINDDDGVKIFMKRTSGLKTRHLHVEPYLKYEDLGCYPSLQAFLNIDAV